MTSEERIQRFQALVEAAIKYTGVNLKAVAKSRMLGDVVQVEAELAFMLVKDWQPPQTEPIEYPKQDEDTEDEKPHQPTINAVVDGIRNAIAINHNKL